MALLVSLVFIVAGLAMTAVGSYEKTEGTTGAAGRARDPVILISQFT